MMKHDNGLPARKGQDWDSNPNSGAPWPILNYPLVSLGHSTASLGISYKNAVLPLVHRTSAASNSACEMARLHVGVLGFWASERQLPLLRSG